jgi:hypothetical protein
MTCKYEKPGGCEEICTVKDCVECTERRIICKNAPEPQQPHDPRPENEICANKDCGECREKSCEYFEDECFPFRMSREKNAAAPRSYNRYSTVKYWVICKSCDREYHLTPRSISMGKECDFCSEKELCGDKKCWPCLRRTVKFAGLPISHKWNDANIRQQDEVPVSARYCVLITCTECHHDLMISPHDLAIIGGCGYCKEHLMCHDPNCKSCGEKSFKAHSDGKVLRWSPKNETSPDRVFQSDEEEYWFTCKGCGHEELWDLYTAKLANKIYLAYQCDGCDALALTK